MLWAIVEGEGWLEKFGPIISDVFGEPTTLELNSTEYRSVHASRFHWHILVAHWLQGETEQDAFLRALEMSLKESAEPEPEPELEPGKPETHQLSPPQWVKCALDNGTTFFYREDDRSAGMQQFVSIAMHPAIAQSICFAPVCWPRVPGKTAML